MTSSMLRTSDGFDLAVRRWAAEGAARAAVVIVHGFAGSKDDANLVTLAVDLTRRRLAVLSYDGRGHGGSGGVCTLGDLERHDVAAAVVQARQLGDHVVLLGASMGGIAALRHAAEDPSLAGVVTVSSPATWRLPRSAQTVFMTGMTRTGAGRRLAARFLRVRIHPRWSNPAPPRELAALLTVPLAVVHGARDRFIAASEAAELHASSGGPARLTVVPGMGHSFDATGLPAIADAVEWVLATSAESTSQTGRAGT